MCLVCCVCCVLCVQKWELENDWEADEDYKIDKNSEVFHLLDSIRSKKAATQTKTAPKSKQGKSGTKKRKKQSGTTGLRATPGGYDVTVVPNPMTKKNGANKPVAVVEGDAA